MNLDFLAATILHEKSFIIKLENFPRARSYFFLRGLGMLGVIILFAEEGVRGLSFVTT